MPEQTNEEDVQDKQFTQIGERLALLLAATNLPQEVKKAWVELVPLMTLEQIDAFGKALEANIADLADPDLQKFADSVEAKKARHTQEKQVALEKANASLDEIEKLLGDDA